jgi:hypothetical protein
MNLRFLSRLAVRLPILSLLTIVGLVVSAPAAYAQATATATHTQWDIYGASASANVGSILRDAAGKAGPAGSIWITTQNPQPRLGRLDPSAATDNYREWRFCPNEVFGCGDLQGRPLGLTLNEGNGDLWVANDGTPSLMVKLGLSNTFRLFVVDSEQAANPGAQGVAVAPPGTLYADSAYVALAGAKGIGRIPRAPGVASGCTAIPEVPGLTLCSFKVWKAAAAPAVEPRYVAVDALGNVWYTDWANNRLGRLTAPNEALTAATSMEWALPTGSRPAGIHFDGDSVCVVSEGLAATGMNPPTGSAVQCLDPLTNRITVFATPTRTIPPSTVVGAPLDLPQQIARNRFNDLFVTESHGNGVVFIGHDAGAAGTVSIVAPSPRTWMRSSIPMYVTEMTTAPAAIRTITPTVVPMVGVVAGTEQLRFPFPTPETGSPERYAQPYGITAAFDDTEPGSGTAFVAQFYSGPLGTFPDAGKVSKIEVVAAREILIAPSSSVEFTVTVGVPMAASAMRSIAEFKGLALEFTATTAGPVPWLTLSAAAPTAAPGTLTLSLNAAVAAAMAPGSYSADVTVADVANRAEPKTITVTLSVVVDTTPPVLTVPGPITLEATGSNGATASFAAIATDNVPMGVTVTCAPSSGAVFALGTTVVECTASDAAGNTAQDSFSITVRDTTAPVVNAPPAITAEATGPAGAAVSIAATAFDLVSGAVPVICAPVSGTTFALGVTPVSCSATDAAGNSASVPVSVTVRDTTAPSLVVPADFTSTSATVTYVASASDLVDTDVAVTCSSASGTVFAIGPTTVTCTATDDAGNSATKSFVVMVPDTTAPTLNLPGPVSAPATGNSGATVNYTVTVSDNLPGATFVCSPVSGSVFPLGPTQVNCTATDAAGNTTPGSFTVTVSDVTAPVIAVPGPIVAEATGPLGAAVSFPVSASDNVDGTVAVSCSAASGSTFAIATTNVSCSATDAAGNAAAPKSFAVTVRDTKAPVFTGVVNATATATGANGGIVSYTIPTATDVVDGVRPVTCSPASNTVFPVGTTTVTCSAADTRGNGGSVTLTVTVAPTPMSFTPTPGSLYFKTGRLAYCNGIAVGPNWKDQGLVIKNTGTTPINYAASTATTWIRVAPASGTLAAGASTTLTVSVDLSHLGRGIYHGAVTVTGNGSLTTTVPVTLEIGNALPTLCASTPALNVGTLRANTTYPTVAIGVVNVGDDPLPAWTVSKTITDGTLTVTPTSGTTNAMLVGTLKTGKKKGTQSATVTINGSGTLQGVKTIPYTWTVQ